MKAEYGVLLPHFGPHATRERLIDDAVRIEAWGFDSVWVRDHLVFQPHDFEAADRTFVDPIVVLSAVAAVTNRITLATGSLIPHRNPVHTALLAGSLAFMAGSSRLLLGWGIGSFDHEFEACGMRGWDRREVLPEQLEIMRSLWTGESVSFSGAYYQFDNVRVAPVPADPVPLWYCGTSAAAVRRTVEYCDGWIPGVMPRRDFVKRLRRMGRLAGEAGKAMPSAGVIPWVSPGRTAEEASKALNVPRILKLAEQKGYTPPDDRGFRELGDLDGAVMVGSVERIAEEVRAYEELGASHIVFDLRHRFDDWPECLEFLGEELLPALS